MYSLAIQIPQLIQIPQPLPFAITDFSLVQGSKLHQYRFLIINMSLVQVMPIKFLLAILLLHLNICTCSDLKIGQVIRFELFNFDNLLISSYFTKLTLGTPPKTFNVLIDTGSDLTWVDCTKSRANFYNTSESSTIVSCPDGKCKYQMNYMDGSQSSGFMVSDIFYFDTYLPDSSRSQFSTRIAFGCSTARENTVDSNIDGILGLGRDKASLVSQLFAKQIAPEVVSHCLTNGGGGYLLLGEVVESGITYSPLIRSESKYVSALESVSVNGRQINSPYVNGNDVTIFDSGTTLTVFAAEVYDSLVAALSEAANSSILPGLSRACFDVRSRDIFPQFTLNFVGGASMIIMPRDYMINFGVWCIGFQRDEEMTILGDLLLRDKVIIYDQPHERIGWLDRNCSLSVNISLEYTTSDSMSWKVGATQRWGLRRLAIIGVMVFFSLML